jgi:hypothetical protein
MRTFRDSSGESWTVFEVRRQVPADGSKGADLSYLPGGYSSGWLCFENHSTKKRLIQYPKNWREFTDAQLEKLLGDATPAPRASLRLTDLGDTGSSSSNLRSE